MTFGEIEVMVEAKLKADWMPFGWIKQQLFGGEAKNPYARQKRSTLTKKESIECLAAVFKAGRNG